MSALDLPPSYRLRPHTPGRFTLTKSSSFGEVIEALDVSHTGAIELAWSRFAESDPEWFAILIDLRGAAK